MTILIVTHQRGFEADPVIDRLKTLGHAFFRLNQDEGEIISQYSFLHTCNQEKIILTNDGRTIEVGKIASAWFQQPPPFTGQPGNLEETLQRNNLGSFLEAVLDLSSARWLNKPSNLLRASNKILQLHFAPKVGLTIPDTIISNSPTAIRNFLSKGPAIVKNLNSPWVSEGNDTIISYTELVNDSWTQDEESMLFCPLIYQKFIRRKHDYRVVMLGDNVFVCRCDSEKGDIFDVRKKNDTGSNFYESKISSEQTLKLKMLMNIFGVNYCSADFIEDYSGKIYFLEMNLCGAWWWMDRILHGRILDAFVKQLV
ncbi:MAG: hypothetical protein WAZ40_02695 [Minisyncoccia bacterium]